MTASFFTVSSTPIRPFSLFSLQPQSRALNLTLSVAMDGAAAASTPVAVETAADREDLRFGFRRREMYSATLAGTVDPPYDRHVFFCYKTWKTWPARVEKSKSDPFPRLLSSALEARKDDMSVKTRLTLCEGGEGTEFSEGDVLIFPEMIKYRRLKESDVEDFVGEVLVDGKPWRSGAREALTGTHVFVCAHATRDRRCGVCGPVLVDKFKEEVEARGLKDQVFVGPCSHFGGHKYAGNLIIFSPNQEGKITGHWYGYVTPADVPELLDQHIGKGEIIERLWRGQMNVSEAILSSGKKKIFGDNISCSQGPNCCQGDNGTGCCQDGNQDKPEKEPGRLSRWLGLG